MGEYWFDMYGKQNRDFIDGVKAGVTTFAIWKDGKQYVGIMQATLTKVLKEIEEQMGGGDGSKS